MKRPGALFLFLAILGGFAGRAGSTPADPLMSSPVNPLDTAACVSGPTALCLNEGRFQVEVTWKDFADHTGAGQAVPLTGDTGYFWFFSANNVELVIKVLDGRPLNNSFWVFYGTLSNVEYTITVTDTASGAVKQYFNASGRFASVGDTSAFPQDASSELSSASMSFESRPSPGPGVSSGLAVPQSTSTSEPTCLAHPKGLCLNGGRFAVEAVWKDFAGNEGRGEAIALSGDTGYFWLFTDTNVELVVKVLDARAIGAGFWVFYGALSNVEYEITVVDTLTGVARAYSNPSGQFASVGDTSAFRAGYPVAVTLDEGRAVSAEIGVAGGEIAATGADGSVYTLQVPPDALPSTETITLTPISSIDRLPLSGGLSAAVQLAPEGLVLFEPAVLTITPASPAPSIEEITFSWRGTGEEFFLYPTKLDLSRISMTVFTLNGYGLGRGTAADQEVQLTRIPGSPEDELSQRLQPLIKELRSTSQTSNRRSALAVAGDDIRARLEEVLRDYYRRHLVPKFQAQARTCTRAGTRDAYSGVGPWLDQVESLGLEERFDAELAELRRLQIATLERCYNDEYDRCVKNRDPRAGVYMVVIYRLLERHAAAGLVDPAKISGCLTFELQFFSNLERISPIDTIREEVKATGIFLKPRNPLEPEGEFLLVTEQQPESAPCEATWTVPSFQNCRKTETCEWLGLKVEGLRMNLNLFSGGALSRHPLVLFYDPLETHSSSVWDCPLSPPVVYDPNSIFRGLYQFLHIDERLDAGVFYADKFSPGYSLWSRRYGRRLTLGSLITLVENTDIFLIHSPR